MKARQTDSFDDWVGLPKPPRLPGPRPSSTTGDVTGKPVGSLRFGGLTSTPSSPGSVTGVASGWDFGTPVGGGGSNSIFSAGAGGAGQSQFQEPDDKGISNQIAAMLQGVMGGQTRFSPQVMEQMKARLRATTDATQKRTEAAIREQGSQMGVSGLRSGAVLGQVADAARQAGSDYTSGVRDVEIQKAMTDFEDKMTALNQAQTWLDRMRAYALSKDSNQIERDKLMASVSLAYAKMAEDRENLRYDQWKFLMNREPIEGRDYTWVVGTDGQRHRVYYNDLAYSNNFLGA